jgi:hypothetical protein
VLAETYIQWRVSDASTSCFWPANCIKLLGAYALQQSNVRLGAKTVKIRNWVYGSLVAALLASPFLAIAQETPPPAAGLFQGPQNAPPVGGDFSAEGVSEDFEVQTRGPLHEAYAEIYQADPEPGLLITKQPPQPIDEVPPNIKPEGEDVLWIPGYWAWDDENEDFLWISGIWRRPPPDHQWAPGYWAQVEGGYRWVSGFWAREGDNIVYREPPPAVREEQPLLNAAPEGQFWVPGSWDWQNNQYVWNNGYYAPCQENWVWMPNRWRWTPRGYIRLAGYWDLRPTVRAMLFAPVIFRPGVLLRPRFVFTPRVVVDPWIAINHFWIRPRYNHYYFGNYYGGGYARFGFQPYANYFGGGRHWDPIFCYYQSHYRRQGIDFHARLHSWNNYYGAHADHRPPLNWNSQVQFAKQHRGSSIAQTSIITSPLGEFAGGSRARIPLVSINDQVRLNLGQIDSRMSRQLLAQREIAERAKIDGAAAGKASDFVKWEIPKIDRQNAGQELRRSGAKINQAIRDDIDGRPAARNTTKAQQRADGDSPKGGRSTVVNEPRREGIPTDSKAKESSLKADMDAIRQRFGNDPVRFQQEMDRLMSRRVGETPSISPRTKPVTPDNEKGLQGSGRAGGLGSPDFRLLPRSGGTSETDRSGSGGGEIRRDANKPPSDSVQRKFPSNLQPSDVVGRSAGQGRVSSGDVERHDGSLQRNAKPVIENRPVLDPNRGSGNSVTPRVNLGNPSGAGARGSSNSAPKVNLGGNTGGNPVIRSNPGTTIKGKSSAAQNGSTGASATARLRPEPIRGNSNIAPKLNSGGNAGGNPATRQNQGAASRSIPAIAPKMSSGGNPAGNSAARMNQGPTGRSNVGSAPRINAGGNVGGNSGARMNQGPSTRSSSGGGKVGGGNLGGSSSRGAGGGGGGSGRDRRK